MICMKKDREKQAGRKKDRKLKNSKVAAF